MRTLYSTLIIFTALFDVYGQDTRHVTEPKIPPSCTVLTAGLTSHGPTLADADEDKPDTRRIQQALDRCKPGRAVELKAGGGHDAFLSAGGTITNKVVYKIDPKKLQLAAEKRLIPKDVVDEVIKVTPNYHVPPPMVLP